MSMNASAAQLASLTKDLLQRWRNTRESWRDDKAREFEERFMSELESATGTTLAGIGELDRIVRKVRSDCED